MTRILRMATGAITPLVDAIAPEKIRTGAPVTGLRSVHEDEARGFYAGIWESSPGSWTVDYSEDEVCVMIAGHVRLVSEDGTAEEFRAGDAFMVPRGFKGVWETLQQARKVYTILL